MESTTYERDKAMETIMKCLRLAADLGATDGERHAANHKAEIIMAKWQISTMEMRLKTEPKDTPRTTANVKEQFESLFDPAADWEMTLASGLAKTFNSRVIVIDGKTRLHFFGSAADLEIIDFFFDKLRLEIDSWSEEAYPRHKRDRRSYAYGMTVRVKQRLDELYRVVQEQMPSDCKALMVVDKALVAQKVNEVYRSLHSMRHRTVNQGAYARGFSDGNNLNLSSNRARVNA